MQTQIKKALYNLLIWGSILSIVFLFSACGNQKGATGKAGETYTVLTYATWNPFEYKSKGKIVGFDVDLIKAIAKNQNFKVKVKDSAWDAMFTSIQQGEADFAISGITITKERKQSYQFSNTYFVSRQSIVVPKGSSIKTANDLKGNTVAVQNGSTGQSAAESILGKNSKSIKKVSNGTTYLLLNNKQADAVIGDDTSNRKYVKSNPESKLKVIESDDFDKEPFGIMFPKNSKLEKTVNKGLKKLIASGEYEKIYEKWFKVKPDLSLLKK